MKGIWPSAKRQTHQKAVGKIFLAQTSTPVRETSARADEMARMWTSMGRGRFDVFFLFSQRSHFSMGSSKENPIVGFLCLPMGEISKEI